MKTQRMIIYYQAITCLFCLLLVNSTFAQWPQWRGLKRDGICTETNLLKVWPEEGPRLAWSVNTVGDGFSSTAIQNKMIYTIGKRDSVEILTAMDLNGTVKWQKPFGRASQDKEWPQSRTTPTVYKNKVYAISVLGDVACFDCKSGNIDWEMAAFEKFNKQGYNLILDGVSGNITESPLIIDDKLIITPCGNTTTMVALNRLTGETIWKSESLNDTTSYASPVLIQMKNNEKTIFTSTRKYDIVVDSQTGKIIWKDEHFAGTIPLVNKNQIFSTGEFRQYGTLCSWNEDWTKRTVIWKDSVNANFMGGAVLFHDMIVLSGSEKCIFCLDPSTGEVLSQHYKMNSCNLLVADNMLYSYEDKMGRVSLFKMNGNNLELVSSFKIELGKGPRLAHLAIAEGILYIRRGEVLMAYDIQQRG